MAKQEDINSRPNKGEDLKLVYQTKFRCTDCGVWTKNTHSENCEIGCTCQPKLSNSQLGLYKSSTFR